MAFCSGKSFVAVMMFGLLLIALHICLMHGNRNSLRLCLDGECVLLKGVVTTNPKERNLVRVADVTPRFMELLHQAITNSTLRECAYVSCGYYIKSPNRIIGILVDGSGFDMSGNDASSYHTTSIHKVALCNNPEIMDRLKGEMENIIQSNRSLEERQISGRVAPQGSVGCRRDTEPVQR